MIYCHQSDILFIIFARDLEDSIENFLLRSKLLTLARNHFIFLFETARVAYYLFLHYFHILPKYQEWGVVRVSD